MPTRRLATAVAGAAGVTLGVRWIAGQVRDQLPQAVQDVPEVWPVAMIAIGAGLGSVNRDLGTGALIAGAVTLIDNLLVRFGVDLV